MNNLDSLTFEQAIAYTENLLSLPNLNNLEFQQAITSLISTANGARGFFVTYLTLDRPDCPELNAIADHPIPEIIKALQAVPNPTAELLIKNLAMSTAMAITHRRQGNELAAQGSDRVKNRTANLIKLVNHPEVYRIAALMLASTQSDTGEYSSFLKKWGYDDEQKQAIADILSLGMKV